MSVTKNICIKYEWDGTPLPPSDYIYIEIELQEDGLTFQVSAPCFEDHKPPIKIDSEKGTWELWNFEVVELFFVGENGEYTEVEVCRHGHHLVLQLDSPRSIVQKEIPMQWLPDNAGDSWYGFGLLEYQWLPKQVVRFNAFAIHTTSGKRRYCCHTPLPGPQPDFHQPDRFALWDKIGTV